MAEACILAMVAANALIVELTSLEFSGFTSVNFLVAFTLLLTAWATVAYTFSVALALEASRTLSEEFEVS